MENKINIDDLRKKKLFIATPMYGGQCAGWFTKSIADLEKFCATNGIKTELYFLFNESLITRARNYCVDAFLRSDCTHMMFIDSDIHFSFADVLVLLHLTGDKENCYDIMTAPYPKKTIAWEKIKTAADKGYGAENPYELAQFVGDYVFNPIKAGTHSLSAPIEIREGGTGFMMIGREVFEKYAEAYPELRYIPDHARTKHFDGTREITAFFDCVIDPESRRYLSEDYMFSQYARAIGLKIWMCPWMKLEHIGTHAFGGSLSALAAIDESPTTSERSNQKHYKKGK